MMFSCWNSTDCEKEGEGTKDTIADLTSSERTETHSPSEKFSDVLEDTIGRYHVRIFVESINKKDAASMSINKKNASSMLNCINDIKRFKSTESRNVRLTLAKKICEGYSDSELSGGINYAQPKEGEPADTIAHHLRSVEKQLRQIRAPPAGNSVRRDCNIGMFRVVENMLMKNVDSEVGTAFCKSKFFNRYIEAKKIREEAKVVPKTKDFKTLIPNLSSGGFCTVYACVKKNTGRVMALKVITVKTPGVSQSRKRPKNEGKLEKVKAVVAERNQLAGLNSRFIVDLKYAMQLSRTKVALVFDLAAAGDLRMLMKSLPSNGAGLPEDLVKFWAAEILLGLECLHKNSIIMRDLKSRNVLLDSAGHVRLCDLGLAAPCKNSMQSTSRVGTTGWMSPEVILMKPYDRRSDYFSYGILIYRLIANKHPFSGKHWQDCEPKYGNTLNKCGCLEVEEYPSNLFSDKLRRFLYSGCMGKYAYERHENCAKFKEHAWFEEIDFDLLEAGMLTPPKHSLKGISKKLAEIKSKVAQYTENPLSFSDLNIDAENEVVQKEGYEVEGITEHERSLRKLTYVNEKAVEDELLDVLQKIDYPRSGSSNYNASNPRSEFYKRLKDSMSEYPRRYSGPSTQSAHHKRVSLSDSINAPFGNEGQEAKPKLQSDRSDYTSRHVRTATRSSNGLRREDSNVNEDAYRSGYAARTPKYYHRHSRTKSSLSIRKVSLSNIPTE